MSRGITKSVSNFCHPENIPQYTATPHEDALCTSRNKLHARSLSLSLFAVISNVSTKRYIEVVEACVPCYFKKNVDHRTQIKKAC